MWLFFLLNMVQQPLNSVNIPAFQGLEVSLDYLCTVWMLATVLASQELDPHYQFRRTPCNYESFFQLAPHSLLCSTTNLLFAFHEPSE